MNKNLDIVPEPFVNADKPVKVEGEYEIQIISPPNLPAHTAVFWTENGVLKGTYETEHCKVELTDLKYEDRILSWSCMAGSHGDELFQFKLKTFFGNVMLGATYRIDTEGPAPESPVMGRQKT